MVTKLYMVNDGEKMVHGNLGDNQQLINPK